MILRVFEMIKAFFAITTQCTALDTGSPGAPIVDGNTPMPGKMPGQTGGATAAPTRAVYDDTGITEQDPLIDMGTLPYFDGSAAGRGYDEMREGIATTAGYPPGYDARTDTTETLKELIGVTERIDGDADPSLIASAIS